MAVQDNRKILYDLLLAKLKEKEEQVGVKLKKEVQVKEKEEQETLEEALAEKQLAYGLIYILMQTADTSRASVGVKEWLKGFGEEVGEDGEMLVKSVELFLDKELAHYNKQIH